MENTYETSFKGSNLTPSTKTMLCSAGFRKTSDLLQALNLDLSMFMRMDTKNFIKKLNLEGCLQTNESPEVEAELSTFIDAQKLELIDLAFGMFMNVENDSELDLDNIGDSLDADAETYETLPEQTLLLNVLTVKGGEGIVTLEEALEELEEEIAKIHGVDHISFIPEKSAILASAISKMEWLGDSPIYVSKGAADIYKNEVLVLSKMAVLILKG
tara:strand:+ start:588 stop:1232 length:645 start_codon:yes stop_codon:yes gene_type:complete